MLNNKSHIFIDIDGTLTDNFHIHTKGWNRLKTIWGYENCNVNYNHYHGLNTKDAILQLSRDLNHQINESEIENFIKVKNAVRDIEILKLNRHTLFSGTYDLLKTLSDNSSIVLYAYSLSTATKSILSSLEIFDFFDDFLFGKFFKISKSRSASLLINYLDGKKINLNNVIVIDDDPDVIKSHIKCNIKTVYVQDELLNSIKKIKKETLLTGSVQRKLYDIAKTIPTANNI